ncbi:hypothetical protein SAMN04487913_112116 [Arthrobacter sp. ok362]|jgi:hypothetical protein|nr:hypothetical protein SAMN04487913_112116 [Arthrobacter sp. ok362]
MPTRVDVTVTADADSLAAALKPLGYMASRSVAALLAVSGLRTPTAAGRPTFVRAPPREPGWGGAA